MKFFVKTLIVAACSAAALLSQPLDHRIEILFANNREVRAAEKTYKSTLEMVKAAGALPDPMIDGSLFLQKIQTGNGPMESQLMLGQKFPLWGKLSRQRKIAVLKAEIAKLKLNDKKVSVAFNLRKTWANYVELRNSLRILNDYYSELESFRSSALTQYATGTGVTQHPILKLQIESSLVESQINDLESELESVLNNLNALFDNKFSTDLFSETWQVVVPEHSAVEWSSTAKNNNPHYNIALLEREIALLQHQLTIRQNYPDLVMGMTYTVIGNETSLSATTPGKDAFGLKLGLNLPLWFKRNEARVKSTELMVKAKDESIEATWNRVEDDILSSLKDLQEIAQTYQLYESKLIREADQMLSSAFAAYETGKITFLDVLDSERMAVRVKLSFEQTKAKRNIASAMLLQASGLY
ncbi:MAG: TolC family protein [Fidelibacterota bacterium]